MAQGLRLVLFGPPGAGKGTQAQLLIQRLGVSHISSGDLFRRHLRQKTPLGLQAAEYMNQGVLVPDEVTIDIVLGRVLSLNSDDGFVLDGFPRNPKQAQVLEDALSKRARGLDKVLHIDVPEAELVRRLSGRFNCRECQATYSADHLETERLPTCRNCGGELYQREDDSPAAVNRRIQVYGSETTPVLEFYRDRGILVDIPGTGSVDSVKDRVLAALDRS